MKSKDIGGAQWMSLYAGMEMKWGNNVERWGLKWKSEKNQALGNVLTW